MEIILAIIFGLFSSLISAWSEHLAGYLFPGLIFGIFVIIDIFSLPNYRINWARTVSFLVMSTLGFWFGWGIAWNYTLRQNDGAISDLKSYLLGYLIFFIAGIVGSLFLS